jgi:hypothetical protein
MVPNARAFWDTAPCNLVVVARHFVALMMEAVRTSEALVYSNKTTRHNIPEDSYLHTRRRENLKSHIDMVPVEKLSLLKQICLDHGNSVQYCGHSKQLTYVRLDGKRRPGTKQYPDPGR